MGWRELEDIRRHYNALGEIVLVSEGNSIALMDLDAARRATRALLRRIEDEIDEREALWP